MSNISEALAAIVNKKKRLRQITKGELAKMVGCSSGFMSEMLNGDKRISDTMLEKICSALGVKLADLENWSPELAEIRFTKDSAESPPLELAKAQAKLTRLYNANKQAFDGVVGTIDVWLKSAGIPDAVPEPAEPAKKQAVA